jgi:hypothetical protein
MQARPPQPPLQPRRKQQQLPVLLPSLWRVIQCEQPCLQLLVLGLGLAQGRVRVRRREQAQAREALVAA